MSDYTRQQIEVLLESLARDESGRHCDGADLDHCTLSQVDLSGLNLSYFHFKNSKLVAINFSNCNLYGASFEDAHLVDCDFSGANLDYSNLARITAGGCRFIDCSIRFGHMRWMTVDKCTFRNVHFGGILTSTDFRSCHMEANHYVHVELSGLSFPDDRYLP